MSEIGDIASILMLNGGGSLPRKGDNPVLEALIDGALKKSQEPGFFSREAGQKRRAWLDETVNYFTPPELRGPLGLINEANPVTSMERASTASQTMLAPETSGWGRVAAGGDMLSNMAGIVAPAMVAGKAGMPAVNAIEEGLLGWAPGMPAAAGNFLADEFGGVPLYGGKDADLTNTGWVFKDVKKPELSKLESKRYNEAAMTGQTEVVPIRSMYATQGKVNPDFGITETSAGMLPKVIRKNGELFVMDGHHRLTKVADEGWQNARVELFDMDGTDMSAPLLDYDIRKAEKLDQEVADLLKALGL